MNPTVHFNNIDDSERRRSAFYISLKADSISSVRNDAKLHITSKKQLSSSMKKFKKRSMETICIDQPEHQDQPRQDDSIRSARMKRYGVVLNDPEIIDPENATVSRSHIQTPIVNESVMSHPTNSKAILASLKVPSSLLPTIRIGTGLNNPSTLPSEFSVHSSATKKSNSFIRRTSPIKLYRHNCLLKSITSKCAMSSTGVGQTDVPVKALDTKQLCDFLSKRTTNENIFRAILRQDENLIEWKTSPNADGSYGSVCFRSSALTLPASDKKVECSSTLSNFFFKRSFPSIPLKRTKSVTKLYVSMSDDLRVSRSYENLLSNHVSLSSIDYNGGATVSILPVHASLLGHRHGFQIYTDTFGVRHYTCRSRHERDLWLYGLRKVLTPNNINTLRVDNCLKIWIYEGKSLPAKKRYFCEIYLDDTLHGRTSSKLNKDLLFWGEYFEFLDIPNPKLIKINVFCEADKKTRSEKLIGSVHIRIQDVMPHVFCEEWYPILTEKKDGTSKRSSKQSKSTLRIKYRFQSLTILPINEYQPFLTYLKENYVKLCESIEPVIGVKAKEEIGQALVLVMHSQNMVAAFLSDVVALDLLRVNDQRLTFRGNSLATKSMEAFLKLCGEEYLQDTLFAPIAKIIESERDCEVDPIKTNGLVIKQQQELRSAVDMTWKAILNSINFFPSELRVCFSTFRDRLKTLGREDISDNLISASLFLRFLCPAILSPNLFSITNGMYDRHYYY
ncbi:ras GTPase-activating protein raskol-like [Anopheles albimanus]|uniref:ras GTPase-activating protein raskol-like n=1 Tax=Anopheles albimanus TaxID=7167 RepID=UPI00164050F6|nr:ras GTPase-activating protein raskol-like [Anopheles albimanus]